MAESENTALAEKVAALEERVAKLEKQAALAAKAKKPPARTAASYRDSFDALDYPER